MTHTDARQKAKVPRASRRPPAVYATMQSTEQYLCGCGCSWGGWMQEFDMRAGFVVCVLTNNHNACQQPCWIVLL